MGNNKSNVVLEKQYGLLTVMGASVRTPGGLRKVECLCECGNSIFVNIYALRSGNTKSCGCLKKKGNPTHGKRFTDEYRIWMLMKMRCSDKSDINYGARGIGVCEEWSKSFEIFFGDMGLRPSKKHSIERINNDLGYSKENCKWATKVEQIRNRRVTKQAFYDGKMRPLAEIAEIVNIPYLFLSDRLRAGWSIDEAIKHPKNTKVRFKRNKHATSQPS